MGAGRGTLLHADLRVRTFIGPEANPIQIVFMNYFVAALIMAAIAAFTLRGTGALKTRLPGLHAARALSSVFGDLCINSAPLFIAYEDSTAIMDLRIPATGRTGYRRVQRSPGRSRTMSCRVRKIARLAYDCRFQRQTLCAGRIVCPFQRRGSAIRPAPSQTVQILSCSSFVAS